MYYVHVLHVQIYNPIDTFLYYSKCHSNQNMGDNSILGYFFSFKVSKERRQNQKKEKGSETQRDIQRY